MQGSILVVGDHPDLCVWLRVWFQVLLPECPLVEVADGQQVVARAIDTAPRLVLMDLALPSLDGIETARQIKAHVPASTIVMLAAREDERHRSDALAAGASAYILQHDMYTLLFSTLSALFDTQLVA